MVLGANKYKVGVRTIRGGASWGKGWMEVTGSAQDSLGWRSYPGVLTSLAQAGKEEEHCNTLLHAVTTMVRN